MRKLLVAWPRPAIGPGAKVNWRPTSSLVRCGSQWMAAVLAAGMASLVAPFEVVTAQTVERDVGTQASAAPAVDPLFNGSTTPMAGAPVPAPAPRKAAAPLKPVKAIANVESTRPPGGSGERLVWDKAPLQIPLGIGPDHERSVTFPAAMHIGVPQEIAHLLRVQTVGRTSYLTALAPFPRARVVAEDRATGAVILLDVTASKDTGATRPITITVPTADPVASPSGDEGPSPVDMVTLTRFAALQMYAPRRLAVPHPAIRRVLVDVTPLDDFYVGAGLRATPAAQWRSDEFHLTAVVLQNLRSQAVELDPLLVRGRWRAITFHHGRLHAAGSEADTTVAYLVCDRSFETCR